MYRSILAGAIALSVLLGAAAIAQEDFEAPEMASCDEEIGEYQAAVKQCLDEATTLEDAKECHEAEP